MENSSDFIDEERLTSGRKNQNRIYGSHGRRRKEFDQGSFRCIHCHLPVMGDRSFAGVNNRNHCPHCLWSKHVDQYKPGDRKSLCCASMEPIGLTFKATNKKYNAENHGELMIIHRCANCGKLSINRIAADDSSGSLLELYRSSCDLPEATQRELHPLGILPLEATDLTAVFSQLFGWQPILQEFEPSSKYVAQEEVEIPAERGE